MEALSIRIFAFIFFISISGVCISSDEGSGDEYSFEHVSTQDLLFQAYEDDLESQYQLGLRYENGRGVPKNIKDSLYWYRTAAKRGHVNAKFRLGVLYVEHAVLFRKEGQIDISKKIYGIGIEWLEDAAEEGHSKAQAKMDGLK